MKYSIRLLFQLTIVVVLGLSLVGGTLPATFAQAGFAGGSGTPEDPYLVATPAQLDNVRNHLDKHFRQTAHINLGVAPWNVDEGWEPIGDNANRFLGTYDGDGYAINNLTINRPGNADQGLFGVVGVTGSDPVIHNLRLENVNIIGGRHTGGLIGRGVSTSIENVTVTGQVASDNHRTGGLVGDLTRVSFVHNAAFIGDVQGGLNTGGLIGYASAEIRSAYTLGTVQGSDQVGGLVGWNNGALMMNTYSRAAVSGEDNVGGLAGSAWTGSSTMRSEIFNSFSTGAVTGTGEDVGGLVGEARGDARWRNCYWDTQSSGQLKSALGVGRTTDEMHLQTTYQFFNFNTLWTMDAHSGYPIFQDLSNYQQPQPVDVTSLQGLGTQANPYLVHTADELNAVRQDLEAHYKMADDIDLSSTVIWDYGRGWQPIGDNANRFLGTFDGDGYTIDNLTVNRPGTTYQGLFGAVGIDGSDPAIHNLRLENVNIVGYTHTGGLIGWGRDTSIEDVTVTGQVFSPSHRIGGLAGELSATTIVHNAAFIGDVLGGLYTGGLIGYAARSAEISNSYTLGTVQGRDHVGGLVGTNNAALMMNTYSRAAVSGEENIGGLAGSAWTGWDTVHSKIFKSFSTGAVTGTGENVGGLVGDPCAWGLTQVENAYWDTETSGQTTSAYGEGRTTDEMTYETAPNTYVGFDFFDTWAQDNTAAQRNNGYPYLRDVTQPNKTIMIGASPTQAGTVSGGGTFYHGHITTVQAATQPGWVFENWTEAGQIVSLNPSYTFSAVSDRDLVANFVEQMPITRPIPEPGGTLYSPLDRTWYDFYPNAFSAEVNITHTFKPFAPANVPDDLSSLGYHFEVFAEYGDGTSAQLAGTVEVRIDFDAAGFSATQSVSLWRLGPTGWVQVPSTTLGNQVLFATLDQFSTFALFQGAAPDPPDPPDPPEPPQPDGYQIFLPLITN